MAGSFNPVRVGVIGVGNFGRLHALTLTGITEAHLVGVVDSNADRLTGLREELPGLPTWTDLDTALREADAEAWVIATRTEAHIPVAERILTANPDTHILIEKPMAESVATARRIEPLVAPNPNRVMVGHILLYAAEIRQLAREIDQRGAVVYFHAFRHRPATNWDYYQETPFRLLMIHDLYVAFAMTQGAEPTRISGRIHPRAGGGYDLALAHLEWANGTWGSITASYLTPPGMGTEGFDRLDVFGNEWAAQLRLIPQPIELWGEKTEYPLTLNLDADPSAPSGWLAEELRHFCRVARGQAEPPYGARYTDALRIQGWLEQLEASAQQT
jgi:predicted dehydrogenase